MSGLARVVSGGQTGVDQAALRAAAAVRIEIGGWCPPGRICDLGPGERIGTIPPEFPLVETPEERSPRASDVPRSLRTEWNVRDSDATLVLRYLGDTSDAPIDPGTAWTAICTALYGRPLLVCDPRDDASIRRVQTWLSALSIRTLNIAGPSEATATGIGNLAEGYLRHLFRLTHSTGEP